MAKTRTVTLLMSEFVTHDVKRFIVSRPTGFVFQPGQGVELAIDRAGWRKEGRPFTPTGLIEDRALEFTIKAYPAHEGVTRELHTLSPGAKLLVSEPFGTIHDRGPGVFIAGGAGITPFLAILRARAHTGALDRDTLIFSNKTADDIVCEKELRHYLGERCILLCSQKPAPGCHAARIDQAFLAEHIRDFSQHFYVCGPPGFMEAVNGALRALGANPDLLVFER